VQCALFLDRPLSRREGLEALVQDRPTALDREAVRPGGSVFSRSEPGAWDSCGLAAFLDDLVAALLVDDDLRRR